MTITLDQARALVGSKVRVTYRITCIGRTEPSRATEVGQLVGLGGATGTALVLTAAPLSLPGLGSCPAESVVGLSTVDTIEVVR